MELPRWRKKSAWRKVVVSGLCSIRRHWRERGLLFSLEFEDSGGPGTNRSSLSTRSFVLVYTTKGYVSPLDRHDMFQCSSRFTSQQVLELHLPTTGGEYSRFEISSPCDLSHVNSTVLAYLGDQVVDMPHILVILWSQGHITLLAIELCQRLIRLHITRLPLHIPRGLVRRAS